MAEPDVTGWDVREPDAQRTHDDGAPLDLRRTLSTLRRGPADPAYRRIGDDHWRVVRTPDGPATTLLRQVGPSAVRLQAWGPGAEHQAETLPRLLGLPVDDLPLAHPVVADARRRFPGLRVPSTGDVVGALVPAIIEQKVLGADAFLSWRQLLHRHGEPAPGPAPAGMRVPLAGAALAALPSWSWHHCGVDPKRYRTAQVATRMADALERLGPHDLLGAYRGLRSIPGIGVWTAAEVGSRAFGDTDAVPFGDYHLASTVGTALLGRRLEHDDEVAYVLEPFRPHRFVALRLMQLSPHVQVERRGARMSRVDHRGR
ncbi:DNA-3-methyladenine glycosylase [Aeromicrobium sp.]|uniref:DNA-3-methyladenine glycosylase family protein n=1 Tax=Aeromicrobium sp. TaxID=1871063 RepID=UPI00351580DD